MSKKHQSIVITGISGSGKTENGKHLIEFLCQTSQSRDTNYVGPIYEAFGNASTRGNVNSSRFCNHIEVLDKTKYLFLLVFLRFNIFQFIFLTSHKQLMYNEDIKQSGFKIHYHLLETNRVCVADPYESNFHIFYALLHGSTFDHSSKLCIDPSISYKVSIWTTIIEERELSFLIFSNFMSWYILFLVSTGWRFCEKIERQHKLV